MPVACSPSCEWDWRWGRSRSRCWSRWPALFRRSPTRLYLHARLYLHKTYSSAQTRPTATDVAWSVCMCVCGTRLWALQNGWTDPPELMAQSVRIMLSESCQAVWIESRDRLAKSEQLADRSYHIMYICLPDQNAYQTRPHRTGLASGVYWTKSKHKLILIHSSYNTSQVDHLNTNSSLIHIIFLRPLLREPRPWMHYKSQPSAKTPRKTQKSLNVKSLTKIVWFQQFSKFDRIDATVRMWSGSCCFLYSYIVQ